MKVFCPFSCILLLSLGACFPPEDGQDLAYPREELEGVPEQTGFGGARRAPQGLRLPRQDLGSLFGLAQELQGFGKDRAGVRLRFGRQPGGWGHENEAVDSLVEEDGEKRAGSLQSLAEELNGYNRKKGGFSFRFGRRRKRTGLWGDSETLSYLWN